MKTTLVVLLLHPMLCHAATSAPDITSLDIRPANSASNQSGTTSSLIATLKPTHPRLIASSDSWEQIKRRREDARLNAFLTRSELEARALLEVPPIPYKKEGKRLLKVSRTVLRRVILLSLQYHLTGDKALAQRAQEEMLNAANFENWNPSHFLDVAEMTAAMALGYDWLYDELDADTRRTILAAIVEKGLKLGLDPKYNFWKSQENNWNSVCLSGLTLGALAVADDEPNLASQILQQTKAFNHNGLKVYAPAGVYPEGPTYWGYGTTFQAMLIDALHSALGTDWGLSQSPGFLQSADALLQSRGPTGAFFNFSDSDERATLEGGDFWYAHELKRPELASSGLEQLRKYSSLTSPATPLSEDDRLLPLVAFWWPSDTETKLSAMPTQWCSLGLVPLAAFRSDWDDPNAMYLAVKGGQAATNHGHMDAGEFIFEADGVRWARDLGTQSYFALESKGINLWDLKQDSQRWEVFRLGNLSHNTITINGQRHNVEGRAEITHFSKGEDAGAILDMSPVFAAQASRVTRGFAFRKDHVLIRDELEGLKEGDIVRWAMVTSADVAIDANGKEATLTQSGKQLKVQLNSSSNAKFECVSADPPHSYDGPNRNTRILIINLIVPPSGQVNWSVLLQPLSRVKKEGDDILAQTSLKNWPQLLVPNSISTFQR